MAVPDRLNTLAVIGNGIIGHGVAEVFAGAGFAVRIIGRATGSLNAARDRIRESLGFLADRGLHQRDQIDEILGRIEIATDLQAATGSELVIEAVPEDMELKLSIFARLATICPAPAVLASSSGHLASE